MDTMLQEVRSAVRSLARARGTSLVIVLTLAFGIGVVSAFFSFVDALLLRPLPYAHPQELVHISEESPGMYQFQVSPGVYRELRTGSVPSIAGVAAYQGTWDFNLSGPDWTESVSGARVSPELFSLLGVKPMLGRLPGKDETYTGAETVVVLGHELWARRFHSDPAVVGTTVHLDGTPAQVVGVMPPGFVFPERGEIWAPMPEPPGTSAGSPEGVMLVARLAKGATTTAVQQQLTGLARHMAAAGMLPSGARLDMAALYDRSGGIGYLPWILLGAAGLVLLIVCSNVASLLLARAARRSTDAALRSVLGASRGRLVGEALLEGGLLAACGGVLGLIASGWILRAFLAGLRANFPLWFHPGLDLRVVAFTAGIAVLSVAAFALPPALSGSRVDPARHLAAGAVGVTGSRRARRLRASIIVGEVAFAFVLVVGGALMALSVSRMSRVDLGTDAGDVYQVWVSLEGSVRATDASRHEFFQAAMARVGEALGPGASIALSSSGIGGFVGADTASARSMNRKPTVSDDGVSIPAGRVRWNAVTPGYFRTVGLALRSGRGVTRQDVAGTPRIAVVSESVAKRLWPHVDPVGHTLHAGGANGVLLQVVGVAADQSTLNAGRASVRTEALPLIYVSEAQTEPWNRMLLVRPAPGTEATLAGVVRRAIRAVDPYQAVSFVAPLDYVVRGIRRSFGTIALLLGALAAAGAGLGAMGIWGVIAEGVAERTREIGIRTALGGTPRRIVAALLWEGLRLSAAGLVGGVALSLLGTRVLRSMLYHVEPADPGVLVGALVGFLAVGWLASVLPARRATRIDPMEALRTE